MDGRAYVRLLRFFLAGLMTKRIGSHFRGRLGLCSTLAGAIILLAACASDEPAYVERPVEELYNEAVDAVDVGKFQEAADLFLEVERQHP